METIQFKKEVTVNDLELFMTNNNLESCTVEDWIKNEINIYI